MVLLLDPNLLINGVSGIAVGMATNILSIGEVVDAIAMLIDDRMLQSQLMTKIKGPDFPGGGIILGRSGIRDALRPAKGRSRSGPDAESRPLKRQEQHHSDRTALHGQQGQAHRRSPIFTRNGKSKDF